MRLCVRVCVCVFAPACVISELPSVPLVSVYSQHPLPLLLQLYDKFWCLPTLFFKIKLIILELLHVLQDSESASQLHTHTHTHTHTHKAAEISIGIASNLSVNLEEGQHLYKVQSSDPWTFHIHLLLYIMFSLVSVSFIVFYVKALHIFQEIYS